MQFDELDIDDDGSRPANEESGNRPANVHAHFATLGRMRVLETARLGRRKSPPGLAPEWRPYAHGRWDKAMKVTEASYCL